MAFLQPLKTLIVIPAYNEEAIIELNLEKLLDFCSRNLAGNWQILVADNASTDRTASIVKSLRQKNDHLGYIYAPQRGKGSAIMTGWQATSAEIYCFMDADLATDLSALLPLISAIEEGSDLAVGSRYLKGSKVRRSPWRLFFSFGYHLALSALIGLKVSDAPCGFKAINQKVKTELLPLSKNRNWFFDSELVILAEKLGYRLKEIPVSWRDPREGKDKSRVNPFSVGWAYLKEVIRIRKRLKTIVNINH